MVSEKKNKSVQDMVLQLLWLAMADSFSLSPKKLHHLKNYQYFCLKKKASWKDEKLVNAC